MSNIDNLPADRRQEIHELTDSQLDAVTGSEYACIRAEWITIDDKGTILPVFYPC